MTVSKPSGLPHAVSSCLALSICALPDLVLYGSSFGSWAAMVGGSMLVAMSPPASAPPRAVCIVILSVAYCTALRQWAWTGGQHESADAHYGTSTVDWPRACTRPAHWVVESST